MRCVFLTAEKGAECQACGYQLPMDFPAPPGRTCQAKKCPHLGDPIERDGITIKVRCGCNGKERDQRYAAHKCGKHKRCLPDLITTKELLDKRASGEIDSDVQLYAWCHGCPDRQKQEVTV